MKFFNIDQHFLLAFKEVACQKIRMSLRKRIFQQNHLSWAQVGYSFIEEKNVKNLVALPL